MSTQLEGLDCVVCHSHLFDDDDVVYCPICGAPHHRDCYHAVGHCALEEAHGTEAQYQRPVAGAAGQETDAGAASATQQPRHCAACGGELSDTAQFCPQCGHATGDAAHSPYGAGAPYRGFVIDPLGGVGGDEKIEDVPARELARYVAVNPNRYIPVFKKLGQRRRVNWNWAAFLFPGGWMWYRKCYKQGLIFIILAILCTVLTFPFQMALEGLPMPADTMTYPQLLQQMYESAELFSGTPMLLMTLAGVLELAMRIFSGLFGDAIYRAHAIEQVKKLREESDDPRMLSIKGGVNLTALLLAMLLVNWIPLLLSMLL